MKWFRNLACASVLTSSKESEKSYEQFPRETALSIYHTTNFPILYWFQTDGNNTGMVWFSGIACIPKNPHWWR